MNAPLVIIKKLDREFDVSKPWLNRLLEREARQKLAACRGVSFEIEKGSTFALVGESGSGKSTVAKMTVGLLHPTGGSIEIDGIDLFHASDATSVRTMRRRIQMIFQDPYASLNPRWRVGSIIAEPLRAFGLSDSAAERSRRVAALLEQVGLSAADRSKYPHEFSGGQRQRICIARALASQPDFLVCDEPTSALDVSVQAQVLNLMKDLQKELGLTYLFISHDLSVVRYMADRIGVMYLGRLVEVAPRDSLLGAPRHPYTRMLIDAAPRLDGFDTEHSVVQGEIPDPIDPPPGCAFNPRCPQANERCRKEAPEALEAGESLVACHAVAEGRGQNVGTLQKAY